MNAPGARRRRSARGTVLVATVVVATVLSRVGAADRLTWWLEASWVLAGLPIAVWVATRRGITPLLQVLLVAHALTLLAGAHWTYERVPAGDWAREALGLSRNHYDRVGHLMQGFVPAILARELLRRTSPLGPGGWLPVLCVACALAFSALFEMLEWGASVSLGHAADAFLGSQGDPWDAQWDMLCCLVGAMASIVVFSGITDLHERQLRDLQADASAP
jgi:putative membrane protein